MDPSRLTESAACARLARARTPKAATRGQRASQNGRTSDVHNVCRVLLYCNHAVQGSNVVFFVHAGHTKH